MTSARARRALEGYLLLTAALMRRVLREGLVLRSLVFPLPLTAGTLMIVLLVVTFLRAPSIVAVPVGWSSPALEAAAIDQGLRLVPTEDPKAWAESGRAIVATDGATVWARGQPREAALVEAALRNDTGTYVYVPVLSLPGRAEGVVAGLRITRLMAGVFALYGVVIGAGMVARDRDDGTLAAELALPVPQWIHGATRFTACTLVIGAFVTPSIVVWDALFGLAAVGDIVRNSIAACSASSAIGLFVMARNGMRGGFSGPLSAGMSAAFALYAVGRLAPGVAAYVPIASLAVDGSGWVPLGVALLFGAAASSRFDRLDR